MIFVDNELNITTATRCDVIQQSTTSCSGSRFKPHQVLSNVQSVTVCDEHESTVTTALTDDNEDDDNFANVQLAYSKEAVEQTGKQCQQSSNDVVRHSLVTSGRDEQSEKNSCESITLINEHDKNVCENRSLSNEQFRNSYKNIAVSQ